MQHKIQIYRIEMILLWYNNKQNKYVCTVECIYYIYIDPITVPSTSWFDTEKKL